MTDDKSEILCAELRREFGRLGVPLTALAPLSRTTATLGSGEASPLIWLGTCEPASGRRLLAALRRCPG
ncbi:hypothetical protein ACWGIB_16710 [Streptomyces xiamenensis]